MSFESSSIFSKFINQEVNIIVVIPKEAKK